MVEIVLGEGLPFFGEDRGLIPHPIHILRKLKTMLGHLCGQISFVSGWEVDGAEREGHHITLN